MSSWRFTAGGSRYQRQGANLSEEPQGEIYIQGSEIL